MKLDLSLQLGSRALLAGASYSFTNAEAAAIAAAFTNPPTSARKKLIDDWWTTVKAAGISRSMFDRLRMYAAADAQAACVNWANPGSNPAVPSNSPAFITDRGYVGDGSAAYIDEAYTCSVNGVALTLNSGHVSCWKTSGSGQVGAMVGVTGSGTSLLIIPRNTVPNFQTRMNSTTGLSTSAPTNMTGHFGASRLSSTVESQYLNGAVSNTGSVTSTNLDARPVVCLRSNTTYSVDTIGFFSIGAGLTDAQMLALRNATLTYMQGIGAA